MKFELNATRPGAAAIEQYRQAGRVQVANFLHSDSAQALRDAVVAQTDWNLVFRLRGQHMDTNAATFEASTPAAQQQLMSEIHQGATTDFQYCFKNIPLYDLALRGELSQPFLAATMALLSSEAFLNFARELCRAPHIAFADGQITAYEPGHFLTRHDDNVAGKSRIAAYVLNLSQDWLADWGGALQFLRDDGTIADAWRPIFNSLSVFRVPVDHSVGVVAPFAGDSRFAVTGWLREGDPAA